MGMLQANREILCRLLGPKEHSIPSIREPIAQTVYKNIALMTIKP